jgi:CheY-like chemotaxis protein
MRDLVVVLLEDQTMQLRLMEMYMMRVSREVQDRKVLDIAAMSTFTQCINYLSSRDVDLPCVMFLDWRLDEHEGVEVAQYRRELESPRPTSSTAVIWIVTTPPVDEVTLKSWALLGVTGWITKPLTYESMLAAWRLSLHMLHKRDMEMRFTILHGSTFLHVRRGDFRLVPRQLVDDQRRHPPIDRHDPSTLSKSKRRPPHAHRRGSGGGGGGHPRAAQRRRPEPRSTSHNTYSVCTRTTEAAMRGQTTRHSYIDARRTRRSRKKK